MREKLQIAICDDETYVAEGLKKLIESILKEMGVTYEISLFQSGQELLRRILDLQVVFLDIDMPRMDGIAVGERIRKMNEKCFVIMETGVEKRVYEAFRFGAIRSLPKPFDPEDVREALETVLDRMPGSRILQVTSGRMPYEILEREIVYARAINGYVELFTEHGMYRKAVSLNQLEQELNPHLFVRVSRQHIVNLYYVENRPVETVLVKGKEFSVSRERKSRVRHAWMEFELKYRKGM